MAYSGYRAFSDDVTAVMLTFQTNPVGVELFFYVNAFLDIVPINLPTSFTGLSLLLVSSETCYSS